MATSDLMTLQRSDLNNFLFADVGMEANGTMLSVVSMFARLGSDPWSEAGRLADLPKPEATDSLAHAIADMPTSPWPFPDAAVIAARLTRLLPARPALRVHAAAIFNIRWQPRARTAIAAACIALAIGYAVFAMTLPGPTKADGSDVGSFSTQEGPHR